MDNSETDQFEATPEDEGIPVCECCLKPVPEDYALFCPNCGAPIDPLAAWLPFERIFAQGYLFRQAAEHPTKLITVIGVWVLFLIPGVLVGVIQLDGLIAESELKEPAEYVSWILMALVTAVYLAIPIRVTFNYWSRCRRKLREAEGPSIEGPSQ